MTNSVVLHLSQANMGAQVRHNVQLNGAPTGGAGVTAIAVLHDRKTDAAAPAGGRPVRPDPVRSDSRSNPMSG